MALLGSEHAEQSQCASAAISNNCGSFTEFVCKCKVAHGGEDKDKPGDRDEVDKKSPELFPWDVGGEEYDDDDRSERDKLPARARGEARAPPRQGVTTASGSPSPSMGPASIGGYGLEGVSVSIPSASV